MASPTFMGDDMARPRKAVPVASEGVSEDMVTVECIVANVWTSAGKLLRGDVAEVPASELSALAGKVATA